MNLDIFDYISAAIAAWPVAILAACHIASRKER